MGLYYQNLPGLFYSQNSFSQKLKNPKAYHYIFTIEYFINESMKLTTETYYKKYKNMPIDPSQKNLFLIDEYYYREGMIFNHEILNDNGIARSTGIEITVQKKLKKNFYGLAGFSYSISQYKDTEGKWRNRVYDNRLIVSFALGYKLNTNWEFSMRWVYAGGRPYTPFDVSKSIELNRGILDNSKINTERLPSYHSLNVRVDRRFNFVNTNLIFYLSVWNIYNRKNIASYFWNQNEKKQKAITQWGILPIFGIEYEF